MKLSILTLTVLAASAWAQPSGGPPAPPVAELQTYLSLTDSQVASMQAIQQQLHESMAATMQSIATKQQTLNSQLSAGTTPAAVLGQELLDIQALRSQLDKARSTAQSQATALLSADQKTKLATLATAASLQQQIQEAGMLGLLAPPEGAPAGPGPAGRGGPGGAGRGGPGTGPMSVRRPGR